MPLLTTLLTVVFIFVLQCSSSSSSSFDDAISNEKTYTISSSCNDKKQNGLYYIKPSAEGTVIPVICNNGYTMLDASLNLKNLEYYFTSMYRYGDDDKAIYGTDCSDFGGWRDWFTPANKETKFRVALNCLECEQGQIHGDNSAYYMTNDYFCPVANDGDGCAVGKDLTGQTQPDVWCNICDDKEGLCGTGSGRDGDEIFNVDDPPAWCDCFSLQLTADHRTTFDHAEYCQQGLNWRPNLMTDRSQCTCYQPSESVQYFEVNRLDLPAVSMDVQSEIVDVLELFVDDMIVWDTKSQISENKHDCQHKETVYLTQNDFENGTFRILNCGNYVLMEDVFINFGAPSKDFSFYNGDSPNTFNVEDLSWFPTNEQSEAEYFGLNAFWGPYSIGFFAAISIECDHVWIDLNDHSIAMTDVYYLQQRFFAIIEIGNKQFEARQGPVDFGRDDICSKDIAIKNGFLGRSSHHGIHASCAQNVLLSNLQISDFDVTGIQCNGCKKMVIENTQIGPQNSDIPVKGRYTHARIVLPRLRYLVDEYGDEVIRFANRKKEVTVRQVANRLIDQMDMIFYHITQNIEFDEEDLEWQEAKRMFLNTNGWLDGGSAYGILLNGFGTAVVNIGRRITDTYDISIRNVSIFGIKVEPHENFWAQQAGKIVHGFFFETIDWNGAHVYDPDTGYYVGDSYTDVLFAANKFFGQNADFCPLGPLFYLDGIAPWAFEDEYDPFGNGGYGTVSFLCGSDIQSHSAKGAIGIRIDGVQNFEISDVQISDITNWGDLGSDACGEYEQITFEKGVDVDKDIQYGYSGDNVHGILTDYASGNVQNVQISNLKSLHGTTNAIAFYKGTKAVLNGNIAINSVIAGSALTKESAQTLKLPNAVPSVCSILIGPNSELLTRPEVTPIVEVGERSDFVLETNGFYGHDKCKGKERIGDLYNVKNPEILFLDLDKVQNVHVVFGNFMFESFSTSIAIFLMAAFVVLLLMIGVFFSNLETQRHTKQIRKLKRPYGTI